MCINTRRFSAPCLLERKTFVLSVPVKGQESMVTAVGSQSGKAADKFAQNLEGLEIVGIGEGTKGDGKQAASVRKAQGAGAGAAANGNPFAILQNSEIQEKGDEEQEQGEYFARIHEM